MNNGTPATGPKKSNALRAALAAARSRDDGAEGDALDSERIDASAPIAFEAGPDPSGGAESRNDAAADEASTSDDPPVALAPASDPASQEGFTASGFAPPMPPAAPPEPRVETVIRSSRATGKRSDPNYTQMTAYIPIDLHEDVKERLARINRERRREKHPNLEISELAETLLTAWLKTQQGERADS